MGCGPRSRRCYHPHRLGPRVAASGCPMQRGRRDRLRAADRVPWRYVPAAELGHGSGVTCWRRLVEWQQVGVWE
jgi:hypothetical protein